MRHELWYTSAPRGLDLGSSGYCTVKMTRGMSPLLREFLERMSHYDHLFSPGHERARENPTVFSCVSANVAGTKWRMLSRICDAGADHTNRTNFFAHHIAYDASEGPHDPVWLASQPSTFAEQWDHRTEELAQARELPKGTESLHPCSAWGAVCGDAGWAGAVADALLDNNAVYIISNGSRSVLPLINEVASLLPVNKRAELTFSTHYQGSSASVNCQLRCVTPGSEEAKRALAGRLPVFDLARASVTKPPESPRVTAARTGISDEVPTHETAPAAGMLPETFVGGAASGHTYKRLPRASQPLPPRSIYANPTNVPTRYSSASEPDSSRAWLPVLSGIGGLALCALILTPFLISYRANNQRQHDELSERDRLIAELKNESAGKKEEITKLEQQQEEAKKKLEYEASEARQGKILSDRQVDEKTQQIDSLNKQLTEQKKQTDEASSKIKVLEQKPTEATSAGQKSTESVAKKASGQEPHANTEPPKPIQTITRLSKPNENSPSSVLIDYVPTEPLKIEIVNAEGFRIAKPREQQWDIQNGEDTVATLNLFKDRQPPSLRFIWKIGNHKRPPIESYRKLSRASLHLTLPDLRVIDVPLYYVVGEADDKKEK